MENSKIIRPKIPKYCICPICKKRQLFKKETENWKTVKDLNLKEEILLKVQMVYAKCLNPECPKNSFALPIPGIGRYSKSTDRVKTEAIDSIVQDNSTCPRVAKRLSRSFNTTASRRTIDRWKQELASKYTFKEIIATLGFSGILFVDEYKPKRSSFYDLIAADAIANYILYLENIPVAFGRGKIAAFFEHLKQLGINAHAAIVDLYIAFPKALRKVWPGILIQYDHFHVMQWIWRFLKNAILQYRRELKELGKETLRSELWEHKWKILKKMEKWSPYEHWVIQNLIEFHKGTIVEDVLIFKEQIWDIFNNSKDSEEAYQKRDELASQSWWQSSWHLSQIMKFLMSYKFEYMITYLKHPDIPRAGNENMVRTWRQMEKVRYGFKTEQGRQNHLKLYQIRNYLKEPLL